MPARHVRVTGRVQGVSYRYYAQQEAVSLGLTGWVRNEVDGSVVLHLEGAQDALDAMIDWCRQGPPAARVREVGVREATEVGGTGFDVTG